MASRAAELRRTLAESSSLAIDSIRTQPARAALAISGIVIGIVTVVLVASILSNVRNQVALLFRDLGTENIFAFHLTGDPYVTPNEKEVRRKPMKTEWAQEIERLAPSIREVGVQVVIPTTVGSQVLTARANGNESQSVLVEANSANYFDVVGAEFAAGRPFTELENREAARVAIVGAGLARSLYGSQTSVGKTLVMGGESYTVVGELEKRRGGFFGENRQDNVLSIPEGEARKRFGEPDRVILYARAKPGMRDQGFREVESVLRRLRRLPADADNDFALNTADQIIATFDQISAQIGLITVGLATVSLLIGAIGIANVMFISVTERTREIGLRLALGARRTNVLSQFLIESAVLSGIGGVVGVAVALALGFLITLVVTTFSAMAPAWAIVAGIVASVGVGIGAGYWPARRAASMDPVEALRHE